MLKACSQQKLVYVHSSRVCVKADEVVLLRCVENTSEKGRNTDIGGGASANVGVKAGVTDVDVADGSLAVFSKRTLQDTSPELVKACEGYRGGTSLDDRDSRTDESVVPSSSSGTQVVNVDGDSNTTTVIGEYNQTTYNQVNVGLDAQGANQLLVELKGQVQGCVCDEEHAQCSQAIMSYDSICEYLAAPGKTLQGETRELWCEGDRHTKVLQSLQVNKSNLEALGKCDAEVFDSFDECVSGGVLEEKARCQSQLSNCVGWGLQIYAVENAARHQWWAFGVESHTCVGTGVVDVRAYNAKLRQGT